MICRFLSSFSYALLRNQATISIASNPTFHECTNIETNCHFVQDKIQQGQLTLLLVHSSNQLVDMFTKTLSSYVIQDGSL